MSKLYHAPSRIAGTGCFASHNISKGAIVGEYTGERIGDKEADARYDGKEMTYLFFVEDGEYIDAETDPNPIKYINHSCSPNCESEQDGKRIYIRAIKTIKKDEELCYDYQLMVDEDDDDEYPCACGTTACRGTMRAPPETNL